MSSTRARARTGLINEEHEEEERSCPCFHFILFAYEDVAGFDVTMDNMRLAYIMDHGTTSKPWGATRFFMAFHVVDGNCPVNKLLEMFSTCRGRTAVIGDSGSCSSPLSRLKLTSRTLILLEETNSHGRLVRFPRDGEMCPSRPFDCKEISVTAPFLLQVAVLRELGEELVKRALLLLCAGAGERSQGDQQQETKAQGRYGRFTMANLPAFGLECDMCGPRVVVSLRAQHEPESFHLLPESAAGEATATGDRWPGLRFRLPLLASSTAPFDCSTQCQGWPAGAEEVEPLLR
uniref:Uncharacterized protein n=1 Tax=Oryza glumipatula TaxID=40148 RepID=A0A0D9YMF7_9ORYZ